MIRTLHAQLADVVREVVKTDEAGFAELIRIGAAPPPETTRLTGEMRTALAAYDTAVAAAEATPLRSLIIQAHKRLEAGDATGCSAALASALLVLDYDATKGPYVAPAVTVN